MVVEIHKKLLQFYLKQSIYVVFFVLNSHVKYKNSCEKQEDLDCLESKISTLRICLNFLCTEPFLAGTQYNTNTKFYEEIPDKYYDKDKYLDPILRTYLLQLTT